MAYSGKFKPTNPKKYKGDPRNICWRSSWELRFMKWCDINPNIISWSSEEIIIPYVSPIDGKWHRYFPDFTVTMKHKDNSITKHLIEIKPEAQTKMPVKKTRKTKKYIKECMTYAINEAKWNAAISYSIKKGMKFDIACFEESSSGVKFKIITNNFLN